MAQNESVKRGQDDASAKDMLFLGRRYRHIRCLGQGAQGTVYLVEDQFLGGRLLAIKSLRPQATEQWQSAFRHEFEVLAGLGTVTSFGLISYASIVLTVPLTPPLRNRGGSCCVRCVK